MGCEVSEEVFGRVVDVLESAWPRGFRVRVVDRLAGLVAGSRRTFREDRASRRSLAWRDDPLERGRVVGTPRFFVPADVLRWCARELRARRFVVGGACLSRPCRCRGVAGARVLPGRVVLRAPVPPLHAGCGCFLVPLAGSDFGLAAELDRVVREAADQPAGAFQGSR